MTTTTKRGDALRVLSEQEVERNAGGTRGSIIPPIVTPPSQIPLRVSVYVLPDICTCLLFLN